MTALRSLDGDSITITIEGIPVPQGSKTIVRRGGKAWMIDANADKLKLWRGKVANEADIGLNVRRPGVRRVRVRVPTPEAPQVPAARGEARHRQTHAGNQRRSR